MLSRPPFQLEHIGCALRLQNAMARSGNNLIQGGRHRISDGPNADRKGIISLKAAKELGRLPAECRLSKVARCPLLFLLMQKMGLDVRPRFFEGLVSYDADEPPHGTHRGIVNVSVSINPPSVR